MLSDMRLRVTGLALSLSLVAAAVAACGDSGSACDGGDTTLTVYAASSLTATFEQIGQERRRWISGSSLDSTHRRYRAIGEFR